MIGHESSNPPPSVCPCCPAPTSEVTPAAVWVLSTVAVLWSCFFFFFPFYLQELHWSAALEAVLRPGLRPLGAHQCPVLLGIEFQQQWLLSALAAIMGAASALILVRRTPCGDPLQPTYLWLYHPCGPSSLYRCFHLSSFQSLRRPVALPLRPVCCPQVAATSMEGLLVGHRIDGCTVAVTCLCTSPSDAL